MPKPDFTQNLEQTQETTQKPHVVAKVDYDSVMQSAQTLLEELSGVPDGDLIADMVVNAVKLLRDRGNRGDLKLINRSFRELRYALKVFTPYRDVRKVSIFGSARTPETDPDYQAASEFAKRIVALGWMVITGAGGGIMAAGHGGAGPEPSFGLAIRLPFEQATNPFIAKDQKLINFKYFFTRKLMFVRSAHAITLFPGGFGTMDEGFEVLTLIQTGKCVPMPVVLAEAKGGTYWSQWDRYVRRALLGKGLISEEDLSLYKVTDNVEEAVNEVTRFYSNFHSIRYHRDELIIRLRTRPTAGELAELERDFADIRVTGQLRLSGPLPIEKDEPDLDHLHRLIFNFDKRSQGRLRQLIDRLNALAA